MSGRASWPGHRDRREESERAPTRSEPTLAEAGSSRIEAGNAAVASMLAARDGKPGRAAISPEAVIGLQRAAGNQAVQRLISPSVVVQREQTTGKNTAKNRRRRERRREQNSAPPTNSAPPQKTKPPSNVTVSKPPTRKSDTELLDGPRLKVGDPDYQRQTRVLVLRAQGKGPKQQSSGGITGFLGSIGSALTSSWSTGGWWGSVSSEQREGEENEEEDEEEGHELAKGEGGGYQAEGEYGEKEQEDEEGESFQEKMLKELQPKVIEIDLAQGEKKMQGTRVGDVSMSGKLRQEDDELKGSGKISTEGRAGKGEASGELLAKANGLEGKGKVAFQLGGGSKSESNTLKYDVFDSGQALEGKGELESFAGVRGGAEGEGKLDWEKGEGSAKGKAEYLIGTEATGTVTVKLTSGGKALGSYEGKVGLGYGLGGAVHGNVSWKGGTLSFGTGGKVFAGVGFSYSYKFEVSTSAIAEVTPNFLSYLWSAITDTDGMTEEDLWF